MIPKRTLRTLMAGKRRSVSAAAALITLALRSLFATALVVPKLAEADVPGGRVLPRGSVPLPGTPERELANLTFPAPYNVFEFTVTCGACHGGSVDQQTAHFGNWAGSNMASAARDPVFPANQIMFENTISTATGESGAGNM